MPDVRLGADAGAVPPVAVGDAGVLAAAGVPSAMLFVLMLT